MADSASESDSSSVDGALIAPSPMTREQFQKRIESLQQENRVLKMELDTYRLRVKSLQEENQGLRRASVNIQARAEQEEEFISNTLLKKIQALKREKETLCQNYEQEEECLTNDLSRKLNQLRQEKVHLEQSLEHEQEALVNKLMRKIERLEADTLSKQNVLEQLRREKVELENTLEQEQESLVNRLWKRMDKLEAEKRQLQEKLDQPVSAPPSPHGGEQQMQTQQQQPQPMQTQPPQQQQLPQRPMIPVSNNNMAATLTAHIKQLRSEVSRLRHQLNHAQQEHSEKMAHMVQEERHIREENLRLHRKLQMEVERREALCRHLSESESSLEMEDERHFNDSISMTSQVVAAVGGRTRTTSSPIPYSLPGRPASPAVMSASSSTRVPMQTGGDNSMMMACSAPSPSSIMACGSRFCVACGQPLPSHTGNASVSTPSAFTCPSPPASMLPPTKNPTTLPTSASGAAAAPVAPPSSSTKQTAPSMGPPLSPLMYHSPRSPAMMNAHSPSPMAPPSSPQSMIVDPPKTPEKA